jgi:hypothetical protein|tara:strand:- start:551 stop:751 length:201 start_codon:yes stop_codon:yes gene_type:complete
MKKIDIPAIIQKHALDPRKVAFEMFPTNTWPDSALARVIQKKTLLNEEQIFKLAKLTGGTIDALYS